MYMYIREKGERRGGGEREREVTDLMIVDGNARDGKRVLQKLGILNGPRRRAKV